VQAIPPTACTTIATAVKLEAMQETRSDRPLWRIKSVGDAQAIDCRANGTNGSRLPSLRVMATGREPQPSQIWSGIGSPTHISGPSGRSASIENFSLSSQAS
jgi:hypothetical protein